MMMMNEENFVAFILTHKRADKVITIPTLRKHGYTGRIVLLVDDQDPQQERYEELYPGQVEIFSKQRIGLEFDICDNFGEPWAAIVWARNVCQHIAKKLGIKYFIQLDDDYKEFRYKFNKNFEYIVGATYIKNLDRVFDIMLEFYKCDERITTIALAQGGDFIGGYAGSYAKKITLKRKAMNSFICSTDRPFYFTGRINEDVNTYVNKGSRGYIFFTANQVGLEQLQTQANSGGMTETYLDDGTYIKSMYSVIMNPSSVKVGLMGIYKRLHHRITWRNAVPKIISEKHKKAC
jgi:hypothetical protein